MTSATKVITVAMLSMLALAGDWPSTDIGVLNLRTEIKGKQYSIVPMSSRVGRAPRWKDEQTNPPLSPKLAIEAARKYLRNIEGNIDQWQVQEVSLVLVYEEDGWLYLIEFLPPPSPGKPSRSERTIKAAVLMDGSVVEAKPIASDGAKKATQH